MQARRQRGGADTLLLSLQDVADVVSVAVLPLGMAGGGQCHGGRRCRPDVDGGPLRRRRRASGTVWVAEGACPVCGSVHGVTIPEETLQELQVWSLRYVTDLWSRVLGRPGDREDDDDGDTCAA